MMHQQRNILHTITDLTVEINRELDMDTPSLEKVNGMIQERQFLADRITELADEPVTVKDTDQNGLRDLILRFEQQQKLMQGKLEDLRSQSREQLAGVVKHRKALQGYRVSKTPDISYF